MPFSFTAKSGPNTSPSSSSRKSFLKKDGWVPFNLNLTAAFELKLTKMTALSHRFWFCPTRSGLYADEDHSVLNKRGSQSLIAFRKPQATPTSRTSKSATFHLQTCSIISFSKHFGWYLSSLWTGSNLLTSLRWKTREWLRQGQAWSLSALSPDWSRGLFLKAEPKPVP